MEFIEENSTHVPSGLLHRTIYEDKSRIAVNLPLPQSMHIHQPDGHFPLVYDPVKENKAIILGMFVLRPGQEESFTAPLLLSDEQGNQTPNPAVYSSNLDWSYNIRGLDGGWLIANGSAVDAFRLGFQYGVSDAVIVGSFTVATEGVPSADGSRPGYVWAPYIPLSWPHVAAVDKDIQEKTQETRRLWQSLGYLSSRRKYPANIVFTWSGRGGDAYGSGGTPDFLSATVFQEHYHPDGEVMETYIFTSKLGAQRIRSRAERFGLSSERLEKMLHILPPIEGMSADETDEVDLTLLPRYLYEQLDIRIAQHDGGQIVLNKFFECKNVIAQFNVTLGRKTTVKDAIKTHPRIASDEERKVYLDEFDDRVSYFFHDREKSIAAGRVVPRGIPEDMKVVSIIEDAVGDDVAIYVLDCRPNVNLSY